MKHIISTSDTGFVREFVEYAEIYQVWEKILLRQGSIILPCNTQIE